MGVLPKGEGDEGFQFSTFVYTGNIEVRTRLKVGTCFTIPGGKRMGRMTKRRWNSANFNLAEGMGQIIPEGYGPRGLVHVSIDQGNPLWVPRRPLRSCPFQGTGPRTSGSM